MLALLFICSATAGRTDPTPAPAASPSPIAIATERVDTMLRTGHADPSWFSDSFLAQVPASKVDAILASLTDSLGKYQRIEFTPARFIAHFDKGTDDILIHLDADNKIDGLLFKPPNVNTPS